MGKFEGYTFATLCCTNFLVSLPLSRVTEKMPIYMDETYHIPQAINYCEGNFNKWNPNITTLPGLYLVSVGIIKPMLWLTNPQEKVECSTDILRFINLLFKCGNLYLLYMLICKLHCREKTSMTSRRIISAFSLSTFPVLFFFNFLYYTDVGSTFFVLFAYLMTLYDCHKASASLGVCAIFFRQTNVVWVAFCGARVVVVRMEKAWRAEYTKKRDGVPPPSQVPLSLANGKRVLLFVRDFLALPAHVKAVLLVAWPYAAVGAGFLLFVALNGSIVVGDHKNHVAVLHFPQVFYFFSFALVFSLPVSLCCQRVQRFMHALRRQPLFFLLLAAASLLLVQMFTHAHEYMLHDDRHYTNFVWWRLMMQNKLVRFALVPMYVFAMWNFFDSLESCSLFWCFAFLVCLLAATVFQKLLEFRYFIIPYLMYRLHMHLPSVSRLALELLLNTTVNVATLYIFITKTVRPHMW